MLANLIAKTSSTGMIVVDDQSAEATIKLATYLTRNQRSISGGTTRVWEEFHIRVTIKHPTLGEICNPRSGYLGGRKESGTMRNLSIVLTKPFHVSSRGTKLGFQQSRLRNRRVPSANCKEASYV